MKKTTKVAIIVLAVLLAFSMSACEWLLGAAMSVSGAVVNARAESNSTTWYKGTSTTETLVGATITLTNMDSAGTDYEGEVGSDGTYIIPAVNPGRYTLSGSKSGWVFVPRVVDVTGFANTLPNLLAYVSPGDSAILLVMEWENRAVDVDMHLVIDRTDADATDPSLGATADILETVAWNNTTATGVTLERDINAAVMADIEDVPTVETILIDSNPFAVSDNTGWLRLYLGAYDAAGELTGYAAGDIREARAQVHVMQGDELLGTFRVASETAETMVAVTKIQVTYTAPTTTYTVMSPANFGNAARSIN